MDAIVPPGNTSLVTNDSDCNRGRYHSDAPTIMANDNANAHAAGAQAERVGFAGIDHTNQNGAEGRLVTNQNGVDGRAVSERNGSETRNLVREEGHETRGKVDLLGIRNIDAIERFGLKNLESTKDGFKDLLISMKDDLRDVLISQKNDFKDVLLKSCQVEKDTLLQFKDAQLVAMQNKADLAAQIAECCCENKELVRAEADQTRQLILKLDEQNLRDKLRKAEEELIALRLRSTLPPFPIAAVGV